MTTPDWLNLRDGVVVGFNGPCASDGRYVRVGALPSEGGDARDIPQVLPQGWRIEVRGDDGKLGLCVFGPVGAFAVDGDTTHRSDIRTEVIAALHAAMQGDKP